MNVFLTFDVEVWCNGWDDLDRKFPQSFERYVYGRSPHGAYALPQTLAILNRHGLKGVFFVEPLFATRFGAGPLQEIVGLIRDAGHEVQLHLHPEWTDEALQPLLPNVTSKRQHLSYYTLQEQTALIGHGRRLLEAAGSGPISAFRSGSFAVNRDSFEALQRNGIFLDTSLNSCHEVSAPDLRNGHAFRAAQVVGEVTTYPVTILQDGFGKDRPAQVGACSLEEMCDGLQAAWKLGIPEFVLVSHNFEMLKPGSSEPDWIVARRFQGLCAYLAQHPEKFQVRGFSDELRLNDSRQPPSAAPNARWTSTMRRHLEQAWRRLH